ncbi:unnamed protein product [Trifolium pratense]|uniref:Uncharacterized protein n=1 Tax=Trifolium pratense TaxID=57577 RepID=A0ACB0JC03_TRIPR|nr:unnamed protein product [Trifolium pratense]
MAFSVTHCYYNSFPYLSHFSKTSTTKHVRCSFPLIRAGQAGEPGSSQPQPKPETKSDASTSSSTTAPKSSPAAPKTLPKKPVYSLKKGQIVRVDKEKYLNSINYLSVGHPTYYKGLDYIYEDRGEVLDMRIFETGEYALVSNLPMIAWVGVPTAPAWLPTYMLIKSEKLDYERL